MKKEDTTITIRDGNIDVKCTYTSEETEGGYICHIPSFDIYFFAKDSKESKIRAKAMIKSFFIFWLINEGVINN